MTTLSDLGVTTNKLRAYGHDGKFEALTGPQLQGLCCWAKAQLDKREGKYKRWSKPVQKIMRGLGIAQSLNTGEPEIRFRRAKVVENVSVSLEDFNRVEDELKATQEELEALKEDIKDFDDNLLLAPRRLMDEEPKSGGFIPLSEEESNQMMANMGGQAGIVKDKIIADVLNADLSVKPKRRKRRSKAQIEADKLKEAK